MNLDNNFWDNRYQTEEIQWDMGAVSPPLKTYFDQLEDQSLKILIPGCGNAWEAEYLWQHGFTNVHLLDWSATALSNFRKRLALFPEAQLIEGDFFQHNGQYDLIIEQTFFCALPPSQRANYVEQVHKLLKPEGKLVGLLFNVPLNTDHPPFGGKKEEYLIYFRPYFDILVMEDCYNSVKPRAGRELFIKLQKKV